MAASYLAPIPAHLALTSTLKFRDTPAISPELATASLETKKLFAEIKKKGINLNIIGEAMPGGGAADKFTNTIHLPAADARAELVAHELGHLTHGKSTLAKAWQKVALGYPGMAARLLATPLGVGGLVAIGVSRYSGEDEKKELYNKLAIGLGGASTVGNAMTFAEEARASKRAVGYLKKIQAKNLTSKKLNLLKMLGTYAIVTTPGAYALVEGIRSLPEEKTAEMETIMRNQVIPIEVYYQVLEKQAGILGRVKKTGGKVLDFYKQFPFNVVKDKKTGKTFAQLRIDKGLSPNL